MYKLSLGSDYTYVLDHRHLAPLQLVENWPRPLCNYLFIIRPVPTQFLMSPNLTTNIAPRRLGLSAPTTRRGPTQTFQYSTRIYHHPQHRAADNPLLRVPHNLQHAHITFTNNNHQHTQLLLADVSPLISLLLVTRISSKDASHHTSAFRAVRSTQHVCHVDCRGNSSASRSSGAVRMRSFLVRGPDGIWFRRSSGTTSLDWNRP